MYTYTHTHTRMRMHTQITLYSDCSNLYTIHSLLVHIFGRKVFILFVMDSFCVYARCVCVCPYVCVGVGSSNEYISKKPIEYRTTETMNHCLKLTSVNIDLFNLDSTE